MTKENQNGINGEEQGPAEEEERDAVWTYRGYRIEPAEFNTAMTHLYRGEITRANTWRNRLDATTNWAVVTTGATISIAFSQTAGHHSVILLNIILITLFLFIEARRYRYYELWSSRIRLMETDYFAAMLVPPFKPAWDWAENLAENLLQPSHHISMWEAFGRRFRRNYLWIYLILSWAWIAKLWLHPVKASSWLEMVRRASFLGIPGEYLFYFLGLILVGLMLIGLLTAPLQEASGEILPKYEEMGNLENITGKKAAKTVFRAWFRPRRKRDQVLVHIVTGSPDLLAEEILSRMNRGVTKLEGKGMYSGEERTVLMSALTVTEIAELKMIIKEIDPESFVIVSPAKDVLGKGFEPIHKK
ncbi:MAG: DUF2270 domain-containing protein [Anaerolineales bacterium]|nr:DUF2270 domain-containing protein [Anaerolineales bacterium]